MTTSASDCSQNGMGDIEPPIVQPEMICGGTPSMVNKGRTHAMCVGWAGEPRCRFYSYAAENQGIGPDIHRGPDGHLICGNKQPATPEPGGCANG